jgi:hypothetical protein
MRRILGSTARRTLRDISPHPLPRHHPLHLHIYIRTHTRLSPLPSAGGPAALHQRPCAALRGPIIRIYCVEGPCERPWGRRRGRGWVAHRSVRPSWPAQPTGQPGFWRKKGGPLCMGKPPAHGPPHTKTVPPERLSDTSTFARTFGARMGSVYTCGREVDKTPGNTSSLLEGLPLHGSWRTGPQASPEFVGVANRRSPCSGGDGDRSPGASVCPALMGSVDRWPLASPET